MRLWHKDLIPVLPRKQLIAQWRECCAISSNIARNGTPNHILVNIMLDYSALNFIIYTNKILKEMQDRGYKINEGSYLRFCKNMEIAGKYFCPGIVINNDIYSDWHDKRYLTQCFYNLQEKFDRGVMTVDEYKKIKEKYDSIINKDNNEDEG